MAVRFDALNELFDDARRRLALGGVEHMRRQATHHALATVNVICP